MGMLPELDFCIAIGEIFGVVLLYKGGKFDLRKASNPAQPAPR